MLNPPQINVVDQCRIVAENIDSGLFKPAALARYLNLSDNKLYKMRRIHTDLIPEAKQWFMNTKYQANMAYGIAAKKPEEQKLLLEDLIKATA
jgi:hypothetical protein